jgi:DNA mismatch repair protein MutS
MIKGTMKNQETDNLTPMMRQYKEIKSRNPDHVLFYRLGDFYEMFFEDAKTASRVLDITLTTRGKHLGVEIPLAGFPHHQINNYLSKMIRAGYKVAVCDQTENPKHAKGIVKRDVTEIVTAGTAMSEEIIEKNANNYIAAICRNEHGSYGFAAADISTGEFVACDTESENQLNELIMLFSPSEIIIPENYELRSFSSGVTATKVETHRFFPALGAEELKKHYKISSVSSLGFHENEACIGCAGAMLGYLSENLKSGLSHLDKLKKYNSAGVCSIDYKTRRNLEILEPATTDGCKDATLYAVMNKTKTPMGARLLRKWLTGPLRDGDEIRIRLEITESLLKNTQLRKDLSSLLSRISDIERLSGKISANKIRPDELLRLRDSLLVIPELKKIASEAGSPELSQLSGSFHDTSECVKFISDSIVESEELSLKEKRFIKKGFSKELDELYEIIDHGKEKLIGLAERVKKDISIPTLKIGYNQVFGYYFEVTKKYSDMIPADFIRKQTLINSERFINTELKEFEEKILNADEKISDTVSELYEQIKNRAKDFIVGIKNNSLIIGRIDCLNSYAAAAGEYGFTRPQFSDKKELRIVNGRHPVVERNMKAGEDYIPNDLTVTEEGNILIITGPNMSGKSTYLRQTAVIVLLAQAGSFVPAGSAVIGMADKIFTRVGASDNLSGGESTFLVEMNETANILNNATPDSLIIFDEVGRGTATFDGLSLAWAIVEHIHNEPKLSSRTLFATHYHELTEIDRICPRVRNFHASVKEHKDEIIFMRKIVEGGADHSYGIYVAKLAGIPEKVLARAKVILKNLEENELTPDAKPVIAKDKENRFVPEQLSLFSFENDLVREKLKAADIDNITPMQALLMLRELKGII